ncbi:MAG TPA: TlpA disulfide reductase family protein [Thermomicrobiales bacterium]|nr:TlpA disulfide reductase family protein [Thermomicrobiales bacterium]
MPSSPAPLPPSPSPDDPTVQPPPSQGLDSARPSSAPEAEPSPFADAEHPDGDADDHGRIGYSRYGRLSSIGLAVLIVLGLVAVGIVNRMGSSGDSSGDPDAAPTAGVQADRPAPDFSLTLFDGSTFSLADQRGKIVVMNFWASWCEPCQEEMPVLEQTAASAPADVVFVGVGAKNDQDDKARQFAKDHGVTYAIGRDTAGGDKIRGQIEQDFRIPAYPATFVIDAEGNIASIKMGEISADELQQAIASART